MTARKYNWIIAALIFIFILVILLPDDLSTNFKLPFIYFSHFPLYVSDASSEDLVGLLQYRNLLNENKALKRRLAAVHNDMLSSEELRLENERLKKLLDYKERIDYAATAAHVIGKDPSNWRNTLIINKGSKDGIYEQAPVLYHGGLAGRVIKVYPDFSRVMLLTDLASRVAVKVQRTRDEGVLEGVYDGLCRLKYLPLDSKAIIGDSIITSVSSSIYPEGIYVGKIVSLDYDPSFTYKIAIVRPESNLINLEDILCLKIRE